MALDAVEVIPRLSSNDLAERAADVGPDPRLIGAVVELDGPPLPVADVRRLLEARLTEVPLLTRRIRPVPWGCGRPLWQDVRPDLEVHVTTRRCPTPGDQDALLAVAAQLAGQTLPPDRPRWRLVVVEGLVGDRTALVWLSDHAAADGPATLRSVVTALAVAPASTEPADQAVQAVQAVPRALTAPGRVELVRDATATRLRALAHLPRGLVLLAAAARELAASAGARAPRTVLNRPVKQGIRFAVTEVDLGALRTGAKSCGATINDAVLCAVGRVLHAELRRRGNRVTRLVISCPVTVPAAGPTAATAGWKGSAHDAGGPRPVEPANRVGVVRMPVPAPDPPGPDGLRAHLSEVATLSRSRKRHLSGASTVVLSPVFRALAAVGLYRPFVEHQRSMNTLVTNLRGPADVLRLCDRDVRRIVPVTPVVGNVPVAAVALSVGGRLSVTLRLAPSMWPVAETLRDALQAELDAICALARADVAT